MAKDANRFRPYPDCFGFGEGEHGGVAGCQCKRIFEEKFGKKEEAQEEACTETR